MGRFIGQEFSLQRDRLLEWCRKIQPGVIFEKVVVWELAQNYYVWHMGTVWEPRGKRISAVGSRYERTGEDTAEKTWCML